MASGVGLSFKVASNSRTPSRPLLWLMKSTAEAASAVDFINQSKGREGVRELLATLNDKPTPEAIEKVYGMSFDNFESKWKDFLKSKGLKEIEGSRVRKLKVKKDQREDEE